MYVCLYVSRYDKRHYIHILFAVYFVSGVLIYYAIVRNEVEKVMFLHLSVSHSVHRGGSASVNATIPPPPHPGADPTGTRHPPGARHPPGTRYPPQYQAPPPDGYRCGRYASYWNGFLCYNLHVLQICN